MVGPRLGHKLRPVFLVKFCPKLSMVGACCSVSGRGGIKSALVKLPGISFRQPQFRATGRASGLHTLHGFGKVVRVNIICDRDCMSAAPIADKDADGWVQIATADQLAAPRPLMPVTLQDRRLVLFRDESGELGLIGRNCPHRGADLCFGRLEDNGLRCPFHGWHFDRTGQCMEQPAEPEGSQMYKAIKVPMIPVSERDGRIFAWIGPTDPPTS